MEKMSFKTVSKELEKLGLLKTVCQTVRQTNQPRTVGKYSYYFQNHVYYSNINNDGFFIKKTGSNIDGRVCR